MTAARRCGSLPVAVFVMHTSVLFHSVHYCLLEVCDLPLKWTLWCWSFCSFLNTAVTPSSHQQMALFSTDCRLRRRRAAGVRYRGEGGNGVRYRGEAGTAFPSARGSALRTGTLISKESQCNRGCLHKHRVNSLEARVLNCVLILRYSVETDWNRNGAF